MEICFFNENLGNKNPVIQASFGGMYKSFWDALEKLNVKITFRDSPENLSGDILVVPLGGNQERGSSKAMSKFKGPVIAYVPPAYSWFYASFLKRWKHKIIFTYGTDASDLSKNKYQSLGIPYYHFPFASDESIFRPLNLPKLYDIVFVGNYNTGVGRFKYIKQIIETAEVKNREVLLIGNGWEKFGHPNQIIAHGKLLNYIYNSAKICLNIHNDIQYKGLQYQMDANNRVFDLAMAGCFQLNNAKDLIHLYFNPDEIIADDNPSNLVGLIDYYLTNEIEREKFSENARKKALIEHTWHNRANAFINMINENVPNYSITPQNPLQKLGLLRDQYLHPSYQLKQIKLYKSIFSN